MSGRRNQGNETGDGTVVSGEERDYTVRAVERVCSILNLLQESIDGVSLIDVGQATDLPKSSAFRYLWTLEAHRYVERDGNTGLYRLGLGFVGMQSRQLEILRERAHPWLERLRDEFEETTTLAILDGDHVIHVDIVESRHRVRFASARGARDPLHSTALGKAIASRLAETRVRELLEHTGMRARTERTITAVEAFVDEVDRVRRDGYAVNDGEHEVDGRCVAAPLPGTRLPAALGISAPAARFDRADAQQAARRLIEVTREIAAQPIPEQRAPATDG